MSHHSGAPGSADRPFGAIQAQGIHLAAHCVPSERVDGEARRQRGSDRHLQRGRSESRSRLGTEIQGWHFKHGISILINNTGEVMKKDLVNFEIFSIFLEMLYYFTLRLTCIP